MDRIEALLARRNLVLRELYDAQDTMLRLKAIVSDIDREVEAISYANRKNSIRGGEG